MKGREDQLKRIEQAEEDVEALRTELRNSNNKNDVKINTFVEESLRTT